MRRMNAREIAVIGVMLGLSLLLNALPLDMPTVWGMKIDLVAVPIVMAYLLTGFTGGVIAVFLLFVGLGLTASSSWLGGMMKAVATFSVIVGFEIARRVVKTTDRLIAFGVVAYVTGTALRVVLMLALNYYVALPVWLGLPRNQVVSAVESWTHVPFWVAIALPNAIQSVIDVFVSLAIIVPILRRIPGLRLEVEG